MTVSTLGDINLSGKTGNNQGTFEELENQFWKNIEKLKKLKKSSAEFKELCNENEVILTRVHEINQG